MRKAGHIDNFDYLSPKITKQTENTKHFIKEEIVIQHMETSR